MADVNYIHSIEARKDWQTRPITYQMGNIGSEVSRSLKWTEKGNQARADKAIDRALELFDFTIEANIKNHARLTEILKAREEFCDYFFWRQFLSYRPCKDAKILRWLCYHVPPFVCRQLTDYWLLLIHRTENLIYLLLVSRMALLP